MPININICKISKCIMYIFTCHTYLILNYNVTHFKHNLSMNNILCARWQIKYLIVLIIPFLPFMNISCDSEVNWIDNVSLNIQRFLYYSYTTLRDNDVYRIYMLLVNYLYSSVWCYIKLSDNCVAIIKWLYFITTVSYSTFIFTSLVMLCSHLAASIGISVS